MKTVKNDPRDTKVVPQALRAYQPPVIVKYGNVRKLTAAGTTGSSEGNSGILDKRT